ncbi:hypothetical protein ACFOZZ_08415 [Catenibacterium sp. GCM10023432]|uniref:hypothetical protein n=1 Tax=Catenibacterium sp. GCM10023432 TaxID=3252638 RepID=UPI00360CF56D
MSKYKVILYNEETDDVVDDFVDGETFDSEDEAQDFIDDMSANLAEGEEILRLRGEWDDPDPEDNYGYGSDDLFLQVIEIED